jgi:hypothetical protein
MRIYFVKNHTHEADGVTSEYRAGEYYIVEPDELAEQFVAEGVAIAEDQVEAYQATKPAEAAPADAKVVEQKDGSTMFAACNKPKA